MKTTKTRLLLSSLSSPFLLLILCMFNPVNTWGQTPTPPPDCVVFVNVTLAAQTTVPVPTAPTAGGVGDNRTVACQTYTFQYQATGTGSLTGVSFQAGQSASTTVTFADWAGTVSTGINPNTSNVGAISTFATGCASMVGCTVPNSWIRILITRGTFVGTINGVLYGYKSGYPGSGGGGGGGGGCTSPCPVEGVTAAGSPPTTPPVLVAGQDGAPGNIRTLKTDATGQQIPSNASSANADGVSATNTGPTGAAGAVLYQRGIPYIFNGSTFDQQISCPLSQPIVISAATDVVIVPLASGSITRICHISLAIGTTGADMTIQQGTGTTCGTNTLARSGAYHTITAVALDFGSLGALRTSVVSRDVCLHFSTSVTGGGTVTYEQAP